MQSAHHFISYSKADGAEVARRIYDALKAGPPPLPVWMDKHHLRVGKLFRPELIEAIRTCQSFIFLMSPDSVEEKSTCTNEGTRALSFKKPVVPLLLDPTIKLMPFWLGDRQYLDFTGPFEPALENLRQHLLELPHWLASPEGILDSLKDSLCDARMALRRARSDDQQARIQKDIARLQEEIEHLQPVVANPQATALKVERSIARGIERERRPRAAAHNQARARFINPPPGIAPLYFQDRTLQTRQIGGFLRDDARRLLTLVGRGGIGKTAMACRLLKALERGHLPDDGGELEVDGIVYLSNAGSRRITLANLFSDLCKLLPEETAQQLEAAYRLPGTSTEEKMRPLLEEFAQRRVVLLLDNFENAVSPETFNISDPALCEALRALLTLPPHGVKVILTTRVAPHDLALVHPERQTRLALDEGLPSPEAEKLLRQLDEDGTLGLQRAPEALLTKARERTDGNPRALELLVSILFTDRNTSLEEFLDDTEGHLPETVMEVLVGEAFSRLESRTQQIMQALAIYKAPVTPTAVNYLLQPFQPGVDSEPVLKRLVNMRLVRREVKGPYYLHPIDREYVFSHIPPGEPADRDGATPPRFTRIALQQRGADFFRRTRRPPETWHDLDDLKPQLMELNLRYAAEDYEGAARVLQEIDYSHLLSWGYYRELRSQAERLRGKLTGELHEKNLGTLAAAYWGLAKYDEALALYEQAVAYAQQTHNRAGEGRWLGDLGLMHCIRNHSDEGKKLLRKALAIIREPEVKDLTREAAFMNILGACYLQTGNQRTARSYHEKSLALARTLGNTHLEQESLSNLAELLALQGKVDQAILQHKQSLELARRQNNRYSAAYELNSLASLYRTLGRIDLAIRNLEEALALASTIGALASEGSILCNLGGNYLSLGDMEQAREFLQRAISIADKIGDKGLESSARGSLAQLLTRQERHEEALHEAYQCVTAGKEVGNPELSSRSHAVLAETLLLAGNFVGARAAAQTATRYPDVETEDNVFTLLGIAALRQDDVEAARAAFEQALEKTELLLSRNPRNFNALDNRCLALCGLTVSGQENKVRAAVESFRTARALTRAPGVVKQVRLFFQALEAVDTQHLLTPVRELLSAVERAEHQEGETAGRMPTEPFGATEGRA